MNTMYLIIVAFLIVLAVFDLIVGVSNDAVNFLNSAIGAKVARFRTIMAVAAIGVFAGAAMSNGMMDVARHGIMTPEYFSFYDVMCVFLAVMVTDVVLLDIFNSLGMPTSTTVSMVFELLGGSFAIAVIQISQGALDNMGNPLSLGDLLNTEKALSVIFGIFLSVAIAFILGMAVQWIARIVFTFTYRVNGKTTDQKGNMGSLLSSSLKIGIFAGIAVTGIIWFLLINGLKSSSFMTPALKETINDNTWLIIGGGFAVFSLIMTVLSALRLPVLKFVILLGTFALAMAFAGNDLVNFVGVPLTGLESYNDYVANGNGSASSFMMKSLMDSSHTPTLYLMLAGIVMVLSLVFSKKARNVVKTSVDLSRQDEGDEMFGSSAAARVIVRGARKYSSTLSSAVPKSVSRWTDSRFNSEDAVLPKGAAFDQIRASVNLVLAGLLVAFGTSQKLPLSTTYVTFMVAMGTSLADRAWSRESAVFRITGVLSVIGGWFLTAGAAFIGCFLMANILHFGSYVAMVLSVILAVFVIVRSNLKYKEDNKDSETDRLFNSLMQSKDKKEKWSLMKQHVLAVSRQQLQFVSDCYKMISDAFTQDEYRPLRQSVHTIETARKQLKRSRKREIIALRNIDPMLAVEKNTWYWIEGNAMEQMLYSLKRINDPCVEHVGNNFTPLEDRYSSEFVFIQKQVRDCLQQTIDLLDSGNIDISTSERLRTAIEEKKQYLSSYRKQVIDSMQSQSVNIESATVYLNLIQESQQILSNLRHAVRGLAKFTE